MVAPSDKPKLMPAKVPWKICASTPFLRLLAAENDSDHPTEVTFVSFLPSSKDLQRYFEGREPQEQLINNISSFVLENALSQIKDERDRIVKLTFNRALWVRMCPSYSDREIIDEATYDWSAIIGSNFEPKSDPEDWGEALWEESRKRFYQEWGKTAICPDPLMYEVENSPWLLKTGASAKGLKHYLILGHDAYIEILAASWCWEFIDH